MKNLGAIQDPKSLVNKEYVDNIVAVSTTQPTAAENKLWVDTDAGSGTSYQIPTVAESLAMGISGAKAGDLVRVNAVDANGRPTSWKHVPLCEIKTNPNLLDNWYFIGGGSQLGDGVFPINQRGQATYTGPVYGIDRWVGASNSTVELGANGVKFTRTAASSYPTFFQKIRGVKAGMTVTLSALVRSHLEAAGNYIMFRLRAGDITALQIDIAQSYPDFTLITGKLTCTEDITEVRFQFSDPSLSSSVGDWVEISAVKLELGSEQTLAHNEGTEESPVWVLNEIPDYGEELAKCQRYCIKLNRLNTIWQWVGNAIGWSTTEIDCFIPTPVTMIRNPSALDISEWMITDGLSYITPSNLALYASSGGIKAVATVTGATQGKAYFVGASNSGESLLVSADL